jgi:L-asparaginase II
VQTASAHRLVVEAWRGERVESRHETWCAVTPAAPSRWSVDAALLPAPSMRSAAKPYQLLPLLLCDAVAAFDLEPADLAVMAASHDGTDAHAARVAAILQRMQIDSAALRCGVHRPYYVEALPFNSPEHRREFGPLHNNCSGNHAAMLALGRAHGVGLDRYLDPEGEGQRRVLDVLRALSGADPYVAVDDCGAPCYAMPLGAMAEAYRFLARPALVHELDGWRRRALLGVGEPAAVESELERIAEAMACEPQWVSGTATEATRLARALPGEIVAKHGAEGVLCVAHRGRGAALALKVSGGAARALLPALLRLQVDLGWMDAANLAELADIAAPFRYGRSGQVVGQLRVAPDPS